MTPRWSPWRSPRSSWASPLTGAFWPSPAVASGHLSPHIPRQSPTSSGAAAWARRSTGSRASSPPKPRLPRDLVLLDSTPVECGRSLDTARRSALGDWAGDGWSRSHSRFFWGMRLHLSCAPDGTPRRAELVGADRKEREVALDLLPPFAAARRSCATRAMSGALRAGRRASAAGSCGRPADEPGTSPPWAASGNDRVGLPDIQGRPVAGAPRGAHPEGLRARIGARILALAACVWLNHQLGRPSRSLVAYVA